MTTNSPTLLGRIAQVSGASVTVRMSSFQGSGLSIIGGEVYRVGQVGSFVRVPLGYIDLVGIVSEIGAGAVPASIAGKDLDDFRWLKVQLVGERVGTDFERGIGQFPNLNDEVHILTDKDLALLYGKNGDGQIPIGRLASSESIECLIDVDKLVTRHVAVMGSTGSGKSTTVASLIRSLCTKNDFKSSRIIILDIHGEYTRAFPELGHSFRINPHKGQKDLYIPYWGLASSDLISFLFGSIGEEKAQLIRDKILQLKLDYLKANKVPGISESSLTADSPVPFSLKKLWYDFTTEELKTLEGECRDIPALVKDGDPENLIPPVFKPHNLGGKAPFINQKAPGIRRGLEKMKSRLIDHSFDFLLHPGPWEPDLSGKPQQDLDTLLEGWLGHDRPITILDLSGVPTEVLTQLIGALLTLIYDAMFWSRDKSEGGINRPLFIVMEEAHRYLKGDDSTSAKTIVGRIAKEGRKYGIGAMIVSQRPSEVDETILSQCGSHITLRLSNPADRARVKGALPDSLGSLLDMLPTLRTGEAIITGEAAHLPMRTKVYLPAAEHRPNSEDPQVSASWSAPRQTEDYQQVLASWRSQSPRTVKNEIKINRTKIEDTND